MGYLISAVFRVNMLLRDLLSCDSLNIRYLFIPLRVKSLSLDKLSVLFPVWIRLGIRTYVDGSEW